MCSAEPRILFVGQFLGQWSCGNRWTDNMSLLRTSGGVGQMRAILYTALVMRVFVILPAAGIGTRMAAGGTSTVAPKQFLEVGGVPVLVRSVRAFLAVPRVDAVCVAVRAQERERVEAQMVEYNLGARVHMVEGGGHRQPAVGNALAALESG